MRFGIFNQHGALNSEPVFTAFQNGLNGLGFNCENNDMSADVAVIWSLVWAGRMRPNYDVWQAFLNSNRSVVVLEVGSILRGQTWKVSLHNKYSGPYYGSGFSPDRIEKLGLKLSDWRSDGRHILIALQRGDSEQWAGQPTVRFWLNNTVEELRKHTNRQIIVRNHPRKHVTSMHRDIEYHKPVHLSDTYDSFDFDASLKNAWAVVNWNSSAACRSVIQGVPVFVGPKNLAAPVGNLNLSNIENPSMPDRSDWLMRYAHTEWFLDEIQEGLAIKRLFPMFFP